MTGHRMTVPWFAFVITVAAASTAHADPPRTDYIFPAGGQRGTTVNVRVGGHNLHDSAAFYLDAAKIKAPKRVVRTKTIFFEGPVIPQPASQRKEDYPKDYAATLKIAKDAKPGVRYWRVTTSQGVTAARKFIVGELPEVVEREIDGAPVPVGVKLPVTINGRIHPREDVDIWMFKATKGQTITAEVNAARLGSPLDSRLEVRDADGKRIAENVDAIGTDSRLTFTAPSTGTYQVRIHDVNFLGMQHYVYRLTITAGPHLTGVFPLGGRAGAKTKFELRGANLATKTVEVQLPSTTKASVVTDCVLGKNADMHPRLRWPLELSELREVVENENLNALFDAPAVLNGRILKSGEVDAWTFNAKKGETWQLDLKAARLGSALDSVVTVINAAGKQVATNDDIGRGQTDSKLTLKIPADGDYTIQIRDQLASRGGPEFAYRLLVTKPVGPGFRITLPSDALSVDREKTGKLKLNIERLGGFKDSIELTITGLPKGVTVTGTKVGKNKRNATLSFKVDAKAKIGLSMLTITGTATIDGKPVTSTVVREFGPAEPVIDKLAFFVAMSTPFKFAGEFETKYAPRGSRYYRSYKLERNGFTGPITIKMADIQVRHLQGVQGPQIVIPPGKSEFKYPVTLAPWMVIGRTSRTALMAVGVVTDKDGTKHKVSYSSLGQNDQVLLLVDPSRLSIRCKHRTISLQPGKTIALPITIARGSGLKGPVMVELIVADHIKGITTKPIVIPAGKSNGVMSLRFAKIGNGPFNMPLILRATINKNSRQPFMDETPLTVVVDGKRTPVSYYKSRR